MTNRFALGASFMVGTFALTGCIAPLDHLRMSLNEDYDRLLNEEAEKEELQREVRQAEQNASQAIAFATYQCGASMRVQINGDSYQSAVDYLEGDETFKVAVQAISPIRFFYNDDDGERQSMDLDAGETRFLTTDVFEPAVDRNAAFCLSAN